ncbi:hypothetical protein OG921_18760 [Aldersonia sp. NBC_00410]|uniref:hypothetical protein n=1 Tax=Aldersonia sp. NBC_00410 TaxID=2975954 RepID=UPI002250867B|nr:hypothetical protein [Aldersonia sp. NBC_00410]MCX5045211.1 hypothetical protein [Aldersonia sp. NBC_00410]
MVLAAVSAVLAWNGPVTGEGLDRQHTESRVQQSPQMHPGGPDDVGSYVVVSR